MNSKMTLLALVVASAFASPALAGKWTQTSGISSDEGYLMASETEFEEALKIAAKPGVVVLFARGTNEESDKNGRMVLSLNNKTYKLKAVDFRNNDKFTSPVHHADFNLNKVDLTLSRGVVFRNASYSHNLNTKDRHPGVADIKSVNTLKLTDSTLNGNVINEYSSPGGFVTIQFNNSLNNETTVELAGASHWNGSLVDEVYTKEIVNSTLVKEEDVHGKYSVNLAEGSTWVGGVTVAEKSTVDVTLDGTSSWTVTSDSTVNSLNAPAAAEATARTAFRATPTKTGVFLKDNVTLTLANGKESIINNLHSGAGSSLAVENTKVKVVKAVGDTHIVLEEKADVTVDAAEKLNATFNSVAEGTKLTSAKDVKANIEVSGELADEMGIDKVIEAFKANNVFTGSGDIVFKGGFVADDIVGSMVNDQFVVEGHRINDYLLSIGDSTAVTMMQWRADADDMAQRMGELRNNEGTVGLWARTFGGKAEKSHISNEYNGLQFGADTLIGDNATKHFVGGAFSYGKGDADYGNGSGDNYMLSMTGYSTWLFESGSYVDVSGKFGKLNNEFDIGHGEAALKGKYNTYGVAMAVETGHRFPLSSVAYIEPQLAFTAAHIMSEDYNANHGIKIEQDSINSYVARVGVQTGLNCPDNMGSFFVRASYLYDFDGETSTKVKSSLASNKFDQDFGGGWYELGVGMNVNFTKNFHGFADFEYASGGEIKTPYRWNAGVLYTF